MSSEHTIEHKLDTLTAQVAELVEANRRRDELFDEMTPILREVLSVASSRLEALEKKGYFEFGKGLGDIIDRVVEGFTPEDVAALAQSAVAILETVRAITQPQMLKLASDLSDAAGHVDRMAPVGVIGMVKASQDVDAQRGMAVMLEVLRRLGHGAEKLDRRERLRAQLVSRKQRAQDARHAARTGVERPVVAQRPAKAPPPAAAPTARRTEPVVIDGIAFTPEGFLVDATQWTPELAEAIATSIGVTLTEHHWKLVQFARKDFAETGASPNIRRLTTGSGISTKEIYTMFPKAPGKCTAMIAGLPKPVGCI
jgi:tRNA 2-thiouridine synthesizing protein E